MRIENELALCFNRADINPEYMKTLIMAAAAERYAGLNDPTPTHKLELAGGRSWSWSQRAKKPCGKFLRSAVARYALEKAERSVYTKKIKRSVPYEHTANCLHPQTGHHDPG